MALKRSKRRYRLTDDRVERVVAIIETWAGRLTGESLTNKVIKDLGITTTRVGLLKVEQIRKAFEKRVRAQKSGRPVSEIDATTRQWMAKIESLKLRFEERDEAIRAYKERFIHLHFNAKRIGIAIEDLEIPMPLE